MQNKDKEIQKLFIQIFTQKLNMQKELDILKHQLSLTKTESSPSFKNKSKIQYIEIQNKQIKQKYHESLQEKEKEIMKMKEYINKLQQSNRQYQKQKSLRLEEISKINIKKQKLNQNQFDKNILIPQILKLLQKLHQRDQQIIKLNQKLKQQQAIMRSNHNNNPISQSIFNQFEISSHQYNKLQNSFKQLQKQLKKSQELNKIYENRLNDQTLKQFKQQQKITENKSQKLKLLVKQINKFYKQFKNLMQNQNYTLQIKIQYLIKKFQQSISSILSKANQNKKLYFDHIRYKF